MVPELALSLPVFRTTHSLFHRALDGLSREQLLAEPAAAVNRLLWIGAHMTQVRVQFARMFGERIEFPWPGFGRGDTPTDPAQWPEYAEVAALYDRAHDAMLAGLERVDAEWLAKPTDRLPSVDGTRLGVVGLAVLHDCYHAGQLAYARRLLGLDRLVG